LAIDRSIKAGQTIALRARFRDDLDEVAVASGVYVHIFEPNVDTNNLALAYTVSGVPTYLGQGIYEYQFTAPDCGPEGSWYDKWQGILNCQDLTTVLSFNVSTTTNVTSLGNQLFTNDVVEIILPSGLLATDGSVLTDEYSFEFMVTTSPSYTNIRKVRLEVGNFISNILDDTIQTSILEASIEADILSFAPVDINSRVYQHARREYVTCLASSILLNNVLSGNLKSKSLGDLSVQYDSIGMSNMLNKLQDCQEKWMPQIMSGGAKAVKNPSYFVKGALDPDRPAIGRLWESGRNGYVNADPTPAANTFGKSSNSRRYLSAYLPKTKKWW
jgi:hypothetical protein